jgi:hypothetical protein
MSYIKLNVKNSVLGHVMTNRGHSRFNLLKSTGYYRQNQVLHYKILPVDYIPFMCFVWPSEQTVTFALYIFNSLVFITEAESVYSAVRTESLYTTETFSL